MIAYGRLKTRLWNMMDDTSDEFKWQILEAVNTAYRDIASDHVWQTLLSNISFTGTVLPADLERPVVYLQDDTDYLQFPISESQRYLSAYLYNFYMDGSVETPLTFGADGVTVINGTAFTSAAPDTDFDATSSTLVGEYIQIGDNEGIYKIASVSDANTLVLEDGFRGADLSDPSTPAALTGQYYEVRPVGTLKIGFSDEVGDTLSSTSRLLWYQKRPLPLYNDYDQLLLPGNCEAVRIQALKMLLEGAKYDNDSLKQDAGFRRAISKMQPLMPTLGRAPRPRDRVGNIVAGGRRRTRSRVDANDRDILGR